MNILLLGNGFDLYHKLPTRYDNFLNTVNYLCYIPYDGFNTVADVFNNKYIQGNDPFVQECFLAHKESYEKSVLNKSEIAEMVDLARRNLWFKYLVKTYNNREKWIDFEKEIAHVLDVFKHFFKSITPYMNYNYLDNSQYFVIQQFDFFSCSYDSGKSNGPNKQVYSKYILEYPFGSGVKVVNKAKIVKDLLNQLHELAKILKLYLKIFVEKPLCYIKETNLNRCPAIAYIDKTVTFNYTTSYEKFYNSNSIFHIHGDVEKKIILCINADNSDNLESIDTAFVEFKKYFQRTQYNTDNEYLSWFNELNDRYEDLSLVVMGHSLDITDKDIIVEIFNKMNEIIILYHNEDAKATYITNLIKIFGKEDFDKLKTQRKLTFCSLNMDFTEYLKHREMLSQKHFIDNILNAV